MAVRRQRTKQEAAERKRLANKIKRNSRKRTEHRIYTQAGKIVSIFTAVGNVLLQADKETDSLHRLLIRYTAELKQAKQSHKPFPKELAESKLLTILGRCEKLERDLSGMLPKINRGFVYADAAKAIGAFDEAEMIERCTLAIKNNLLNAFEELAQAKRKANQILRELQ